MTFFIILSIVKQITSRAYTSERTCHSLHPNVIAVPVDFHWKHLTNRPLRSVFYDMILAALE